MERGSRRSRSLGLISNDQPRAVRPCPPSVHRQRICGAQLGHDLRMIRQGGGTLRSSVIQEPRSISHRKLSAECLLAWAVMALLGSEAAVRDHLLALPRCYSCYYGVSTSKQG